MCLFKTKAASAACTVLYLKRKSCPNFQQIIPELLQDLVTSDLLSYLGTYLPLPSVLEES